MNQFSSTTSNSGLLKDSYTGSPTNPTAQALKKKREKLAESKLGLESDDNKKEE